MNGCEAHDHVQPMLKKFTPEHIEKYNTQMAEYKKKVEAWKIPHRQNHLEMGINLAKKAGLNVKGFLAGADKADLKTFVKPNLAQYLAMTASTAHPSTMRNMAEIVREREKCTTVVSRAEHEAEQARR